MQFTLIFTFGVIKAGYLCDFGIHVYVFKLTVLWVVLHFPDLRVGGVKYGWIQLSVLIEGAKYGQSFTSQN